MKQYKGFTLIEVMLALSLFAIVLVMANWFWQSIRKSYEFGINQYTLTEKATQTVRKISGELRQAQEAMNGAYPLATLEDNQLTYYADINSDGQVERVRYYLQGTTLIKGIISPSGNPPDYLVGNEKSAVMVEGIDLEKLPLFYYYNGNWPGDVANNPLGYWQRPLETKLIKVTIPIVVSSNSGEQRFATESLVQIRNLKDNL